MAMAHYYDIVLTLIPASLIGTAAFLTLVGIPTSMAVPAGAFAAAGLIGHAMFVKGPATETDDTVTTSGSSHQPPSPNAD